MKPLLKGMPLRMAILDYGLFQVREDQRVIGISGYLIQTSANENILIDTGFPAKYAQNAKSATAQDGLGGFGKVLSLTSENLAPAQLALLGLAPSDIDLMVQSHTHIDHVGFIDSFPGVPIVIAAAERALSKPLYWSGKQPIDWPNAPYVTLDTDTMLGPGFEALLVPGHTPGQLAFSILLPKTGSVMLTSDAISRPAELDTKFAGAWNEEQALFHANRLLARAITERSMLIYGHSPEQWSKLRKAPDWYD